MGCSSSKEARKNQAGDMVQIEANQGAAGTAAAAKGTAAAASAVNNGTETSKEAELNVMDAEKMDLKDLVEKEPFHDVYMLGEVLGRGNYSVVRKGTKKGTDDVFAIKCIKEASLTHEDREALKIETAILKSMDSPHIIKLYGFYEEKKESSFYIVTEFVGGGELFDRIIAREYYSENDAQKLTRTVASALKLLHDKGIVHRDLKPENILLTSKEDDGDIKLADFGFAKQYDTSSDDALSTSCGTPGYVAPEILNGKKYGKEVDMWSLGVIIYILLCGYPPFHHENQKELFRQIRTAQYDFEPQYWGEVSAEAKDLISKLLVIDGSKRLTIDDLLDHPWLKTDVKTNLTDIQPKIQAIINKRKLKAGIAAVMAQNRMVNLANAVKAGAMASATEDAKEGTEAAATEVKSEATDEAAKVAAGAEAMATAAAAAAADPPAVPAEAAAAATVAAGAAATTESVTQQ